MTATAAEPCAPIPTSPAAERPKQRRRGTILVALVMLVVLSVVVIGVLSPAGDDALQTALNVQAMRAQYAAESAAKIAAQEVKAGADLDGDGGIGTVAAGVVANGPAVGGAHFAATSSVSGQTTTITATGTCDTCTRVVTLDVKRTASGVTEGFETYADGTVLNDPNGWQPWDSVASVVGYVTNTRSRMGTKSTDIRNPTDNVHLYTPTSGQWTYTAWQYIPAAATGSDTYFILMNTYVSNGPKAWSTQVRFDLGNNLLYDNMVGSVTGSMLTIIRDHWVPIVVNIDLDAGTQTVTYNGATLFTASWNRLGGVRALAAVDLYGSTIDHVYYDDIQLAPAGSSGGSASTTITTWQQTAPVQ